MTNGLAVRCFTVLLAASIVCLTTEPAAAQAPSPMAQRAAEHAATTYETAATEALAKLVSFPTVHEEGVANAEHPAFRGMSVYLRHARRCAASGRCQVGAQPV